MMTTIAMALWQGPFRPSPFFNGGFLLFSFVVLIIVVVGGWKVFEKCGAAGLGGLNSDL